jgi:tetratricopeptide (TPR) repeat protein
MRHWTSWPILSLSFLVLASQTDAQQGSESTLPTPQGKEFEALDKLKAEREKLLKQLDPAAGNSIPTEDTLIFERAKLRLEIAELLKRLEEQKTSPPPIVAVVPKVKTLSPEELTKSLDPLAQAKALYLATSYEAALKAFKLIDSAALTREDRTFVQYMIASCLRRLGNLTEATQIYREVADAGEQEFLRECAVWQLSNIRWRQELEGQLEDLRKRLKK